MNLTPVPVGTPVRHVVFTLLHIGQARVRSAAYETKDIGLPVHNFGLFIPFFTARYTMDQSPIAKPSRRGLFAGVATVGAVAAVTSVLPKMASQAAAPAAVDLPKPERGGGYSLSEHVKRYYQTTRV